MTDDWFDRDHGAMARQEGAARAVSEGEAMARLAEILGVVFRLRDEHGCPWDRKQTLQSMSKNLQEEAAETVDAIAANDDAHVAEELGDVLMNVLLMARIGEDEGRFDLAAVATGIATKLVRRHPHVFGDVSAEDADAALASWNAAKLAERGTSPTALDGVPAGLPPLLASLKLGYKAAGAGFDWPDATGALDKLREEVDELHEAVAEGDPAAVEHELGDVLFSAVNVARKTGQDPDVALRRTMERFRRRFAHLERVLGEGLASAPLPEMERLWREAAAAEDAAGPANGQDPQQRGASGP
jgi:MazG family protein